jgi:hypothetical protein
MKKAGCSPVEIDNVSHAICNSETSKKIHQVLNNIRKVAEEEQDYLIQ